MKIIKQLWVDGKPYPLIDDDVRLDLKSPGRAAFRVKADKPLSGPVEYHVGLIDKPADRSVRWFLGFVDRQSTVSASEQLLFCREVSAALNRDLPMGLRRVTARDVLGRISRDTRLTFVTNNPDQMARVSPYFHHCGGGYQAMDAIGDVFQIPNYIWQQQGDGSIFVGSWDNSRWADEKRRVTLPDNLFTRHLAHNTATIALLPPLRPGVRFNRGIITTVQLKKQEMVITWKKPSAAFC